MHDKPKIKWLPIEYSCGLLTELKITRLSISNKFVLLMGNPS